MLLYSPATAPSLVPVARAAIQSAAGWSGGWSQRQLAPLGPSLSNEPARDDESMTAVCAKACAQALACTDRIAALPTLVSEPRRAATGRERQYTASRCGRSAGIWADSVVATCERPLSPSMTFSTASAKINFQGRPVSRRENRHGRLWVVLDETDRQVCDPPLLIGTGVRPRSTPSDSTAVRSGEDQHCHHFARSPL
jgi:hypothetical protein